MNDDDKIKDALDEIFNEDFDKYSKKKDEDKLSYTLLNIPKIKENSLEVPNISEYETRRKVTYYNNSYKKKIFFVAFLFLFIVISIGYPILNDKLEINGFSSAFSSFKINASCNIINDGELKSTGNGKCSVNETKISTTSALFMPTDKVNYMITITNAGSLPVVLKNVISSNNKKDNLIEDGDYLYLNEENLLSAKYSFFYDDRYITGDNNVKISNITLNPSESVVMIINHEWLSSDGILDSQPVLYDNKATISYDVVLEFMQVNL